MKLASIIMAMLLFSCSKPVDTDNPAVLYLNDCNEYTVNAEVVRLCFNNLVSDSRCPENAMCIWEGLAVANFTFKKDDIIYPITLSTIAMPPQYIKDTIVAGYKIELLNLYPYPKMHSTPSPKAIRAEVKVTRL
jgi:hypothetical protein